jgi:DNA-binding Xre family transcriptional regulator
MKEKGISRQELSHTAGISYSSLSRLSNNLPLQMESLVRICKVLDCKVDDIMDY